MGVVYQARQTRLLRDVALKSIKKEKRERDEVSRAFVSEALITGLLDHPNVVPIYDLIETEDGESAIAMKRIGGISWLELLHPESAEAIERAAEFDQDDHIEILIAVCNAVAYAHSKGIIHRDLKPSNVMVGEFGEVVVMDWGMAVVFDHNAATTELEHRAMTRSRESITRRAAAPATWPRRWPRPRETGSARGPTSTSSARSSTRSSLGAAPTTAPRSTTWSRPRSRASRRCLRTACPSSSRRSAAGR